MHKFSIGTRHSEICDKAEVTWKRYSKSASSFRQTYIDKRPLSAELLLLKHLLRTFGKRNYFKTFLE